MTDDELEERDRLADLHRVRVDMVARAGGAVTAAASTRLGGIAVEVVDQRRA